MTHSEVLARAEAGRSLSPAEALALADCPDTRGLMRVAASLRDQAHGDLVSYSRKVFIPLTQLCRDVCHYCTFAHPPRADEPAYLSAEQVLDIARAGARAGCHEALFTLGDKPELRYAAAREALARLGHETTLSYLAEMAALIFRETGLLPHLNPGVMTRADIDRLRTVSVSQGIMLESAAERLRRRGGPHFGSPDKDPGLRLDTIRAAGEAAVPFTTGILIGIGETRRARIESLLALRDLHDRHGHLQEIIIQNFRAKPGTRMAQAPEPDLNDHLWTIAVARLIFGPEINIQAPPNLNLGALAEMIAAGINDWGGVSPVTPDHVNPERPWPTLDRLAQQTAAAGKLLVERLAVYPAYARGADRWVDPALRPAVLRAIDAQGLVRPDDWVAGSGTEPPLVIAPHPDPLPARGAWEKTAAGPSPHSSGEREGPAQREGEGHLSAILDRAAGGEMLREAEIVQLFAARGEAFKAVCRAADRLRQRVSGDQVSYVVTRNINYTNICYFRCQFCAFSKGKLSENLRGRPYDLDLPEIQRRVEEAWERGATEVCLQGGIHPEYTGATYLAVCRAIKQAVPGIHIHAFSPLEIWQGAKTLGRTVPDFLHELKAAGLSSLPGTAAEILDDEVRAVICPDKIKTGQWLEVMEAAHTVGLRSTVTIMYGHVDRYEHWARHLLRIRALQTRTGGFTEFVPLPFVPMETPIYLKGRARRGPTYREAVLMHAVGRLVLHPVIANIQTSWVKMGGGGAAACLQVGANDVGGTLMNESITRAAGAVHGQEMPPESMEALIRALGREPRQRTTLYADAPADRKTASFGVAALTEPINTPARRYERHHESAAAD
ncbi:MAG TPA: 5-amino-6-(D-ribitylamino)uracil--L-tyrosine 4-hydroxyphenyl transferase CofH [Stellaceae bacterium]|nr:5-amino-6-(D-ribitylamino)uracil--L-tyrosine 4-hydroxyphenyl transferase CofH [Stellaceae bacterium]